MQWRKCLWLGLVLIFLAACSGPKQYADYYVSIQGSDAGGSGSASAPWRTIQYALNQASYPSGITVRINLAKGIYEENIIINRPVVIRGVGPSEQVSVWANDPLNPVQNVSVISRQVSGSSGKNPDETVIDPGILILGNGVGQVVFEDLNIYRGGLTAKKTNLRMQNVFVTGVVGLYGVQVRDSSFVITDSKIITQPNYSSDYGLHVIGSGGFLTDSYVGPGFDHAINIEPWDTYAGGPSIDFYSLPAPLHVYITGVTVEGSKINYADGIRIQGVINVTIKDSTITRAANAEPASGSHNRPFAGIEVAGWMVSGDMVAGVSNSVRRVQIINTVIAGFDVGIGMHMASMELMVEGSSISGRSYGAQTLYNNYSGTIPPVVDFGGGPLGSQGKNTFSNQPSYAFQHDTGPYDVSACFNNWMVANAQVDSLRIYDKLDKASLGRVNWNCPAGGVGSSSSGLTVASSTASPSPQPPVLIAIPQVTTNCRKGNSRQFDIADTLFADVEYAPNAQGADGLWLRFVGPATGTTCWAFVGNLTLWLGDQPVEAGEWPSELLAIVPYPILPTVTSTPEQPDEPTNVPVNPTPTPRRP